MENAPSMTTVNKSALCMISESIVHHPGIIIAHVLMCVQSIINMIGQLYVSYRVVRQKVFHINLRCLITLLNLMILMRTTVTMLRSGHYTLTVFAKDPCDLLWSLSRCKATAVIVSDTVVALGYGYATVAVERCIALCFKKRYERCTRPVIGLIGLALVVTEYSITLVNGVIILLDQISTDEMYLPYCASVNIITFTFTTILTTFRFIPISIGYTTVFIGLLLYVRHQNKKWQRDSKHSLTTRFQERITNRATRLIIPNAVIFFFLYIFSLAANTWSSTVVNSEKDLIKGYIIKEYASFIYNFYGIIYPVIFILVEPAFRLKQAEFIPDECKDYHDNLAKTWEKKLEEKQKKSNFLSLDKNKYNLPTVELSPTQSGTKIAPTS